MQVFWSKGYKGTSLHDLTDAMGVSKSSFYEAFGSKHELFLAAIRRYEDTVVEGLVRFFRGAESGRAAIDAAFEKVVECAGAPDDRRGCFLVNCASEVSVHDPQAAARVREGLRRIEQAIHGAVVRGQEAGEIPGDRDAWALARYLATSLNGLRLRAKANPDRAALEDVVRITLSALE